MTTGSQSLERLATPSDCIYFLNGTTGTIDPSGR